MKCFNCQKENPPESRFCSACAAPLGLACRACGRGNRADARFCGECGAALGTTLGAMPGALLPAAADPAPVAMAGGERRQATVMFSDISGYTAMTERLDPEDVSDVLAHVRQAASRVIAEHGGTINQFIGDEVMALFGVPHADEDDPVRAIKAALALHAAVAIGTEAMRARDDATLALHTGINTGLIMAQYRNDREGLYQLTGDAVNTAARLRALAGAGEVVIGPSTQRLVRPYFLMEPLAQVAVKGKANPLVPYRVVAESRIGSRFEAARERGFKGYVGRTRELETLGRCHQLSLQGEGQLVTIEGEAGIGKSRLLYEFLKSLDRERVTVPQGRCQPHGSEIPYFPFLDSLRRSLHLSEQDTHAQSLEKAVANLKWIDASLERYLPHLLQLLSIPSEYTLPAELKGEALRRAIEEALVAVITRTTQTEPMVLVIEDWHWSDPASQSVMRSLLRLVPAYRLMLVVTSRSGHGFDLGKAESHTSIRLNALDAQQTDELIRTVTGAAELPDGLGALLCQSADGNPLFIEEACYSLLESGAVSVIERRLELREALNRLLLPDTVQAVIRARLDRLDDDAKEVVGRASVIGRIFSVPILARICPARTALDESLDVLQAQEIIRQTRNLPEPEYMFRHVLTREVAYDALLHQQRKQLHEAVGVAIEAGYPQRLAEYAPILAHHFARSARADKAVQYALLAGDRAAELFANVEAAAHYDDAFTLVRTLPASAEARRWQIDAIVGQVGVGIAPRDVERDRRNLEQACAYAEELGDRTRLARSLYWLGRSHYVQADLERAIEYARRSQQVADEIGDAAAAAPPVNLMGRAYWQLSDFVRSGQMMERSVEQMRVLGNKSEESTAAGFVSALFGYMGEFDKAIAYSDRSVELARELKNPYAESAAWHYRGIIRDQQGQWPVAIADYATALSIAEKCGDLFRVYLARFMQGRALAMAGDMAKGCELAGHGVELAAQIGTTFLLGQAKSALASCRLALGDVVAARALCEEALVLADAAGDKFTKALVLRTLAEVLCVGANVAAADAERALQSLAEAIEIQQGIGALPELARSHASRAAILGARGHTQDALADLERARALFAQLAMASDLAAASAARAG